jgi:LysM repeat protein
MRLIAPIGVAIVAALLLFVIATSLDGSDSDDGKNGRGKAAKQRKTNDKFYVVEPGDSLTSISKKTGVGVDKISRLNAELDPQALISGQKVRLRR